MKLEDGDSPYGKFVSPSGREVRTFSEEAPLPEETDLKVHYLGSLSSAVEVLGTFDEEKKGVLRSMKFEGVVNFVKFKEFDLYFFLWVMTKLDCASCCISIGGDEHIPIRDEEVGKIIGIPYYGIEVFVEHQASFATVSKILKILQMADTEASISMKHFEKVLRTNYGGNMTKAQVDAFKIAVVVFTMANVLATAGDPKNVPIGILKLLTDPSKIQFFNWGLLVRRYLLSWGHFIQQQLRLDDARITIGGCFLLPVIAYLDNVQLGSATMLHYGFPRSGVYDYQKMTAMIAADTNNTSPNRDARQFGRSQAKPGDNFGYGRWLVHRKVAQQMNNSKRKSETILRQYSSYKIQRGLVAKLVLLEANKSMRREIMKSTGLAQHMNFQKRVTRQDGFGDVQIRRMDAFMEDLMKADSTSLEKCSIFFKSLKEVTVSDGHKTWFQHLEPYEIKINGSSLESQLRNGGRYCTTVCDAIIRYQNITEDIVFSAKKRRERHLLCASFMETYRKRDIKMGVEQLRKFFIGDHVKYVVTDCIQINMPVSYRRKWSCYSWNLKYRTLTVLDPSLMKGPVSRIKHAHAELVAETNGAFFSCLTAFFPEYINKENDWKTIYRNDISDRANWADTGLYSMHYALTFNTDSLSEEISWECDFMGRWISLWRILDMEGNIGEKPAMFNEIMGEG